MPDLLVIIFGSISIVFIFFLMFAYFRQRSITKTVAAFYANSEIERMSLLDKLESIMEENESLKLSDNVEFIKFLSDSREWAYSYIEEVQALIEELKESSVTGNNEKRLEVTAKLILMLPEDPEALNKIEGV